MTSNLHVWQVSQNCPGVMVEPKNFWMVSNGRVRKRWVVLGGEGVAVLLGMATNTLQLLKLNQNRCGVAVAVGGVSNCSVVSNRKEGRMKKHSPRFEFEFFTLKTWTRGRGKVVFSLNDPLKSKERKDQKVIKTYYSLAEKNCFIKFWPVVAHDIWGPFEIH